MCFRKNIVFFFFFTSSTVKCQYSQNYLRASASCVFGRCAGKIIVCEISGSPGNVCESGACLGVTPCRQEIINGNYMASHSRIPWSWYSSLYKPQFPQSCLASWFICIIYMCDVSLLCLYTTASEYTWSWKKANLADQWPYTADL